MHTSTNSLGRAHRRPLTLQSIPPLAVLVAVSRCLVKLLGGRLSFCHKRLGRVFVAEDGGRFTLFRDLRCRPADGPDPTPALFVVSFKFARFGSRLNRWLSWIPVPLIAGHAGFREKVWVEELETGYWRGIYEWESKGAARAYTRSFVLGRMFARAATGTVTMELFPQTRLNDYLAERLEAE